MSTQSTTVPLPFNPAFEKAEAHEAETTAELIATMQKISAITTKDYGHAVRSVHAKSHGLLKGELTVAAGLPATLAQGIFANPGSWPLVMRFSTTPGDILDDKVSTPRGMAIKVIGVAGARLPGSEGDLTQDFLLVNGPAFLKPDAKSFLGSVKLLAATTDKAEGAKKLFSTVLQGTEKLIESVGGKSATITSLGGQAETNVLGETYYSQVPILFGDYFGKISVVPVSPSLIALTNAPVDLHDKPNGLREAVAAHFATQGGEWELRVQLCTDLESMPVEDASVAWPEDTSPYLTVARITVAPQPAWDTARETVLDEGLSFSPWHGIAAHRPLGSVMRVRRAVYEALASARRATNGRAAVEPRDIADLPL